MGRYVRGPTVTTLAVLGAVFLVEVAWGQTSLALSLPLSRRPWTLVTNVYAHGSVEHLVGNAVALAVLGVGIERRTTPLRFHGFFLASGAFAGLAEVTVRGLLGEHVAVLGASGAVLALFGYAMVGNPLARGLLSRLDPDWRTAAVGFVALAGAITLAAAAPRVALVAHFAGLLVGIAAGRAGVLEPHDRS